ncbi:MAG: hypothetical protein AMXMBFR8_00470 [Nevskiales bacterium]
MTGTNQETGSEGGKPPWRRYRWPMVAAVLLAGYALAGFVLAPWLIARELPGVVREAVGRDANIGRVELNPFALTLRAEQLNVLETDGNRLAGFDEIFINVELESLVRRALVLSELRVRAPYLNLVHERSGEVNLLKLLPPDPEPGTTTPEDELPRVVIRELRIGEGVLDVTDRGPLEPFRTRVGPFAVALDELSTLPDATGRHDIAITLESGTKIAVQGELSLTPLRVGGSFRLDGPFLGTVHRYVRDQLAFDVTGGQSMVEGRFAVAGEAGGALEVAVSQIGARVTDVALSAATAPDFLRFAEFSIVGGEIRWPALQASVQAATLRGLAVKARRERDGTIDLAGLLAPRPTAGGVGGPSAPAAPTTAPAWKVSAGEVAFEDMTAALTDLAPATPAVISVADLDLRLRDVGNEPGARMPLELAVELGGGGRLSAKGSVVALPEVIVEADVGVEGVKLAQFQPWLDELARIRVRDGALALDGRLSSDAKETLAFDGDLRITGLELDDRVKNEKLLAWQELGLDDLQFRLDANRARIVRVRLVKPFARVFIDGTHETNVGALLIEGPATTPPEPATAPFEVRIDKVLVSGGDVDFTDLSLPLPFAARILDLQGEFTTIDTRSTAPSRISLEGRVNEFGLARVNGQVRVNAPTDLADVTVLFRNIEMPSLSPYTVKFAGRRIAGGKINLDLRYRLEDRHMIGSNRIVIDELELGEKVPNPDAADLPLGLAVALLKDANGRIDIDMPVTGSLDDPEFGVGSVLWKAFVNLVTKLVTSPFRLLGGLIGDESDELGRIEFSPGRSDLLPPEREKLVRVAEALGKRPELGIEIPAVADPKVDAAALQTAKMVAAVEAGIAAAGKPATGRGLEKRTRAVVETLFVEHFPAESLEDIEARFVVPPPDDPAGKPRLDELAYLDELRGRIAAAQVIGETDLATLGTERAAAIAAELAAEGRVAPERVRTGPRRDVEARDGEWIPAELGIAVGE